MIVIVVILGLNFYPFYRLWQMLPPVTWARVTLVIVAVILVGSFFVALLARDHISGGVAVALYKFGTSWFIIMLYLLLFFVVVDVLRLVRILPMDFMRGSWVALGIVVGALTVIMTVGYLHYLNKTRVELKLATEKWPIDVKPVKIVAVSDLHLGLGIGAGEAAGWVERINAERPDLVIMAGDVIDTHVGPLREQGLENVLRRINAPLGVYAIPGNHEYIAGIASSLAFLEEAGVRVLRDSTVLIDSAFYLVGRDDLSNDAREPLSELTKGLDPAKPMIVMDHQPVRLEEAEAAGADLQFSGHTHRGQVWPITWITDAIFENSHGLSQRGNTRIYVSSGLGIWGGKFRIGSSSEYVVITLQSK